MKTAPSLVFVGAKRTPFGAFGGSFKTLTATDLAVHAAKAAIAQSGLPETAFDHVVFGNVQQTSSDASYLARHVGLRSGLPEGVPAVTVNRLCGSGFEAIAQAARLITSGEATTVLCGGTESMSQAPFVLRSARFGYRLGNADLEDSLTAGLFDTIPQIPMAITAENLAVKYGISRQECDEFALRSQLTGAEAARSGKLAEEIVPITFSERGKDKVVANDEHLRPESTIEGLAKLKPVFKKDGVVTAGNASGMVDGAAALVLTTRENAQKHKLPILGEWLGGFAVGCDPKIMGIGPVPAVRGLLSKLDLKHSDFKLFEINEAFAAQVLAVQRELQFPADKLNAEGGSISIGHPLGASGARLTMHLLYALKRQGGGQGLASACIGGGQGMSVAIRVG